MTERKSSVFLLRLAPTEAAMLRELADDNGMSQAGVVRQLVRKEHKRLFGKVTKRKR